MKLLGLSVIILTLFSLIVSCGGEKADAEGLDGDEAKSDSLGKVDLFIVNGNEVYFFEIFPTTNRDREYMLYASGSQPFCEQNAQELADKAGVVTTELVWVKAWDNGLRLRQNDMAFRIEEGQSYGSSLLFLYGYGADRRVSANKDVSYVDVDKSEAHLVNGSILKLRENRYVPTNYIFEPKYQVNALINTGKRSRYDIETFSFGLTEFRDVRFIGNSKEGLKTLLLKQDEHLEPTDVPWKFIRRKNQ